MSKNADKVELLRSLQNLEAECLSKPPADWPVELTVDMVQDVDSALRDEPPTRKSTAKQVEATLNSLLAEAPEEVRAALTGEAVNPAVRAAFLLGQLTCARRIVLPWWERKPSPTSKVFLDEFDNPVNQTIIAAMRRGPQDRLELFRATGLAYEVFSRHFSTMLNVGIVECNYWKDAKNCTGIATEWFLSPAAEAIANERNLGVSSAPG